MKPVEPKHFRLARLAAGCLRFVGGLFTVLAGMLVGGGLSYALAVARGNALTEQTLGGITVGAIVAVLRATRYRYAWGVAVGTLLGWNVGFSWDPFLLAAPAAILGGCLGPVLQKKLLGAPPEKAARVFSVRAIARRLLGVGVGIIAGGLVGAVVGFWLCMIVVFGALGLATR